MYGFANAFFGTEIRWPCLPQEFMLCWILVLVVVTSDLVYQGILRWRFRRIDECLVGKCHLFNQACHYYQQSELYCPPIPHIDRCCRITRFLVHLIPFFCGVRHGTLVKGFALTAAYVVAWACFVKVTTILRFLMFPCFRNCGYLLFRNELLSGWNQFTWLKEGCHLVFLYCCTVFFLIR